MLPACGPRLLLEFLIALIGRRFVVQRVHFFLIDGFFFDRAGSGEHRGLLMADNFGIGIVGLDSIGSLLFAAFWLGYGRIFSGLFLGCSLMLDLGNGPGSEHRVGQCLWPSQFLMPIGRYTSRLIRFVMIGADIFVLLMQWLSKRRAGEYWLIVGKSCSHGTHRVRLRFRRGLDCRLPRGLSRRLRPTLVLGN